MIRLAPTGTLLRFALRVAQLATLALLADRVTKTIARVSIAQCYRPPAANCDRLELLGPLWMLRTSNAGLPWATRTG